MGHLLRSRILFPTSRPTARSARHGLRVQVLQWRPRCVVILFGPLALNRVTPKRRKEGD